MNNRIVYLLTALLPIAALIYLRPGGAPLHPVWIPIGALYVQLIKVWRLHALGYPKAEIMKSFVPFAGVNYSIRSLSNTRYEDSSEEQFRRATMIGAALSLALIIGLVLMIIR